MKRLISIGLAVLMSLSLCIPAVATDDVPVSNGKVPIPIASAQAARSTSNRSYLKALRSPRIADSEIAEHYAYNSSIDTLNGNYIISQGYCPNYTVGGATFAGVGCEIAATYNAMKAIGRQTTLPSLIRNFEKSGYLMLGGNAGSDPFAIGEFFSGGGINYVEYAEKNNYLLFKNAVEHRDAYTVAYIVSFWIGTAQLHTVMFLPKTDGRLEVYNISSRYNDTWPCDSVADISDNMADNFIVGYVIKRDNRR